MSRSPLSPAADADRATLKVSRDATKDDARDTAGSTEYAMAQAYPKPAATASAPSPHAGEGLVQGLDALRPWMGVARQQRLHQGQRRSILPLRHQGLGLEELQRHHLVGARQALARRRLQAREQRQALVAQRLLRQGRQRG